MDRKDTLETVRQIQRHVRKCAIAIRWFSSEYMHSPTQRRSKKRGNGHDFRGFKEFDPAVDDIRHIDAFNSARSGDPDAPLIVKTFFQPMDVRVNVLLDVWHSMHYGTVNGLKSWLGAAAAGSAIYAADKTKDRAALVTYSSTVHTVHQAKTASRLEIPALVAAVEDHAKVSGDDKGEGGGLRQGHRHHQQTPAKPCSSHHRLCQHVGKRLGSSQDLWTEERYDRRFHSGQTRVFASGRACAWSALRS